ncbi:antitoxin [Agrococcus sp. 1P02AA]|uniref:antitoxin n=1 Tax=Agrococcus sp. 1P02AA TaxID=3132259 RepID=UPI0039A6F60E
MDDLTNKAKEFVEANKEQIDEALKSEQAEDISDNVLRAVAEKANQVTGGEHADKIEDVRANIDGKIGNQ